jgi:hypothetical protein
MSVLRRDAMERPVLKTTDEDREILDKMRKDPPGIIRTPRERIAFEHWWDDQVALGLEKAMAHD